MLKNLAQSLVVVLAAFVATTQLNAQAKYIRDVAKVQTTGDGHVFVGRDPELAFDRFKTFADPQIQKALKVETETIEQFNAFNEKCDREIAEVQAEEQAGRLKRGSFSILIEGQAQAATALLDELLTPEQLTRLRQMMYRMESMTLGLGESLTEGRLGVAVGVYDDQVDALTRLAEKIDLKMQEVIEKAQKEAEEELLAGLTPEQREKARSLLGEPFRYRLLTHSQYRYYTYKQRLRDEAGGSVSRESESKAPR